MIASDLLPVSARPLWDNLEWSVALEETNTPTQGPQPPNTHLTPAPPHRSYSHSRGMSEELVQIGILVAWSFTVRRQQLAAKALA